LLEELTMSNPFMRTRPVALSSALWPRRAAQTFDCLGLPDPDLRRQGRLATGLAALTVLLAVAIVWAWASRPEPTPVCGQALPTEELTFLIDASDPLSSDQQQFVTRQIEEAANRLVVGGRLRLVHLVPQVGGSSPLIESEPLCKPRDGSRASFLTENARLLKGFFDDRFKAPLKVAVAGLNQGHPAGTTPLLEGLHALANRLAGTSQSPRRELVIVSDLLQNSKLLSLYRGTPSFAALAQQHSAYLQGLEDGFGGLRVVVYRLKDRSVGRQQAAAHRQFWEEYFKAVGVRDYRVFDL
jgi:hypothetical protein